MNNILLFSNKHTTEFEGVSQYLRLVVSYKARNITGRVCKRGLFFFSTLFRVFVQLFFILLFIIVLHLHNWLDKFMHVCNVPLFTKEYFGRST